MTTPEAEPTAVEEERAPRPVAGGCVVVALAGGTVAGLFAVSQEAGVLAVWASGVAALYWAARRPVSDSSAPPPPEGAPPESSESAGHGDAAPEGADLREGMSIIPDPARPGRWIVHHHYAQESQ